MTQVSDFHYELPEELIAQQPLPDRSGARMLVVSRASAAFRDELFSNFDRYIRPGDCLVLNNTRVFPARLHGRRGSESGAEVEVFLVRALNTDETEWKALVRPGKRVRCGDRILFQDGFTGEVLSQGDCGERTIRLHATEPIPEVLERLGNVPLPPYIHRTPDQADRERYQTVFAQKRGSVAAPTAGLHFTPEMIDRCRAAGAEIAHVTLHVGLGTFAPLRADTVEEIELHEEYFEIAEAEAEKIRSASRVFCVGTTSVRTVETAALRGGLGAAQAAGRRPKTESVVRVSSTAMQGETNLFIYPGFRFRCAGAMLTNFHLPQSSLLMLVAAFAGKELALAAYRHAVAERYRFFSYGDCMLIE